jgi:hypothetical protein
MKICSLLPPVLLLSLVGTAAADESATPTAVAESTSVKHPFELDASFTLSPSGQLASVMGNMQTSLGTGLAYGIAGHIGYRLNEYLCLGFAPQYLFNIAANTLGATTASEVDLFARVTGSIPLAPKIDLHAYVSPGLSMYNNSYGTSPGFGIAGAVGAAFSITEQLHLLAELGYQTAFFNMTNTAGADLRTSFVTTTLGIGTRF